MKLRLLLAEDEAINLMIISRVMTKLDTECVQTKDGQEALNKFIPCKFDAVFLDINMPVMTGLESAELIIRKCLDENKPLPYIISMSADETPVSPLLFACSVIKPINLEDIQKMIDLVAGYAHAAEGYSLKTTAEKIGLDLETIMMLSEEFVSSSDEEITALNKAVIANDGNMITHVAHKMKGSSANMFMEPLREACAEMQAADKTDQNNNAALMFRINSIYNSFRTFLVS